MEPENIHTEHRYNVPPRDLPNAVAVLVMGILSIVCVCCYGLPSLILSIVSIILASKDIKLYHAAPEAFTVSSYKNLKAGRVCAIVGLSIFALYVVAVIFIVTTLGFAALTNPNLFSQMH